MTGVEGTRESRTRRPWLSKALVVVLLSLGVVMSACGGDGGTGEPASDEIAGVLDDVWKAVDEGDVDAICERLGRNGIEQVRTIGHARLPSCQAGLRQLVSGARAIGAHDERPGPEILDLELSGPMATARVRIDGRETHVPFVIEDGSWKIDAMFGREAAGGRL